MKMIDYFRQKLTGEPSLKRNGREVVLTASHRLPSSGHEEVLLLRILTAAGVVGVLVAHYRPEDALNAEQKEAFLRAMFAIVVTFVELGFGVHPLQQVGGEEPCGKDAFGVDQPPNAGPNRVNSGTIPEHKPKNRHGPEGRLEAE